MSCAQCRGIEQEFGSKVARRDLKRFRRKGPDRTTRLLIEALEREGVKDATLIDIGGGIGAIHHLLLDEGARAAAHVDASSSYLEAAREEAARRGHTDRVSFRHGDFLDVAPALDRADVVTLDRVICCYPDMERLVAASAGLAGRLYGVVYPRDNWLMRRGVPVANLLLRLKRSCFRVFIHPTTAVDAAVRRAGLVPRAMQRTLLWQVWVYGR
jgi:SAM-dependent methyltransferase